MVNFETSAGSYICFGRNKGGRMGRRLDAPPGHAIVGLKRGSGDCPVIEDIVCAKVLVDVD